MGIVITKLILERKGIKADLTHSQNLRYHLKKIRQDLRGFFGQEH